MALIKCPECGGQVSDKAPACIHCGCPLPSNTASKKFYVNINGRSYDMTELKEMYQAYSPEDQELIYQYCKSTFNIDFANFSLFSLLAFSNIFNTFS